MPQQGLLVRALTSEGQPPDEQGICQNFNHLCPAVRCAYVSEEEDRTSERSNLRRASGEISPVHVPRLPFPHGRIQRVPEKKCYDDVEGREGYILPHQPLMIMP